MRLGEARPASPAPPGVRVVIDARPLQDPGRAPITAAYLRALLTAYAADPIPGESFVEVLDLGADDPLADLVGLPMAGRRRVPVTRVFRSAALALDPFLIRGAALGAARGARRSGGAGAVAHSVGGSLPIGPGLPVVATLLDLAPWELPERYQGTPGARFGQRLRAQLLRDAAVVLVGTEAVASAASRLLRLRPSRVRVLPLAGSNAYRPLPAAGTASGDAARASLAIERDRLGLTERYLVVVGRHDARQDLRTTLEALARLAASGRPARLPRSVPWPPRILILGATPEDRAGMAREAAAAGVGDQFAYAPGVGADATARLVAGARAAIVPATADATGLAALDALAAGTPVVASAVGALPEVVGTAGLLVEPGDADRLALAIRAAWAEEPVHRTIAAAAAVRAGEGRRTWRDVATETRAVYAEVVAARTSGPAPSDERAGRAAAR